jgi:hypothetical protein
MKRINIAGTSLITGTALADAILAYWINVARLHRMETAEIPFIDDDGSLQCAQLVLCSDVPIWTSTVSSDGAELTDVETLAVLRQRTAELEPSWGLAAVEFDD